MTSLIFYWIAVGSYVLSSVALIGGLFFLRDRLQRAGLVLAVCGLLFHSVSLGLRWLTSGHGPYISTYEILSSNVWIAVLFFLLLQWRLKVVRNAGAIIMPLSFLMMGFALVGSTEAKALPPSLRSAWLVVHIIFAKLTVSAMLVAVALSTFYLFKTRKRYSAKSFLEKLPTTVLLNDYIYRLVAFGFISLTIMIITGSIWANNAWGSYWAWRPTETWSLVVWFVYGLYLHGRITFHWRGMVSSWYVICAFLFSLVAFFILPFFIKAIHSQYMVG